MCDEERQDHDRARDEDKRIEGAQRINRQIAEERERPRRGVGAQENLAALIVMGAQVDELARLGGAREEEHGHEKNKRDQRDEQEKGCQVPALDVAHAPKRPPIIGIAQQHAQHPDAVDPVGANPLSFFDQARDPRHQLGNGDAEHDGVKNNDEIERVHNPNEAFSVALGNRNQRRWTILFDTS